MRVENAAHERFAKLRPGLDLQVDGAEPALEDRDLDDALTDLLLRQVGDGEEVAAIAVVALHSAGRIVQAVEVEGLADEIAHRFGELGGREDGVAAEAELLHRHLQVY